MRARAAKLIIFCNWTIPDRQQYAHFRKSQSIAISLHPSVGVGLCPPYTFFYLKQWKKEGSLFWHLLSTYVNLHATREKQQQRFCNKDLL